VSYFSSWSGNIHVVALLSAALGLTGGFRPGLILVLAQFNGPMSVPHDNASIMRRRGYVASWPHDSSAIPAARGHLLVLLTARHQGRPLSLPLKVLSEARQKAQRALTPRLSRTTRLVDS